MTTDISAPDTDVDVAPSHGRRQLSTRHRRRWTIRGVLGEGWLRLRLREVRLTPHQRRVRSIARALVAVQVVYVTWACFRGFFFTDDLVILGKGAQAGWLDPELLLQPWGGHFMPAAFALAQVSSKLSNLNYGFVAVSLAIGQAIVVLLVYQTLHYLVGWRYRMLPLLTMFLVSIPLLQATVWWASALNALPFLGVIALSTRFFTGYVIQRRAGQAVATLGCVAAGLAFFEKAVLLAPFLFMLAFVLAPRRRPQRAIWWAVRQGAVVWIGILALLGVWAAFYLSNPTSEGVGAAHPDVLGAQVIQGLLGTFAPSLLGGPWSFTWGGSGAGYTLVITPLWLTLACVAVLGAVAMWLMSHGFRARRALFVVVAYGLMVVVLLNLGRSVFLVATANLPRYYVDLVLVTVFMLALATARLRLDKDRPGLREPEIPESRRPILGAAAVVVANAYIISALVAGQSLVAGLDVPFVRNYILSATNDLSRAGTQEQVLNHPVPADVVGALNQGGGNTYDAVFSPLHASPAFPEVTDSLLVIDDFGRLGPGWVDGVWSRAGRISGCGWKVTSESPTIPLDAEVVNWTHTMRIGYLASRVGSVGVGTAATVRLGTSGTPVDVVFQSGLHDLYLNISGGGRFVRIEGIPPGDILCVDRIMVGVTKPGIQVQIPASPARPGEPFTPGGSPAAEQSAQPGASSSPEATGDDRNAGRQTGGGSGRDDSRRRDRDRNRDDAGAAG